MWELPTTVSVKDKQFNIRANGDFRMVLDCFATLQDETMSEDDRVLACLLIFYNEFTDIEDLFEPKYEKYLQDLIKEMFKFFNGGEEESPGAKQDVPLIDWEQDSMMICAAINQTSNQEVRLLPELHWFTFLGYYMSINDKSVFATVIAIRDKIVHHKKLEKWERDFKNSNPKYFIWKKSTVQDREAENLVRQIWNKGGG